jgi:hypothetical protein
MLLTLLVLVPLLGGLVCWPLRERAVVERLNLLAFASVAVLAAWLGAEVLARGTVEAFGGFRRVDALSALVVCLTAFVALACSIYAAGYLREEERAGKISARLLHRYYVFTPIFVGTMMALPLVNNLGLLWVAVGACGCSGGIFGQKYAGLGGVDRVIPVDVYIPGCPPNPHALLHGIRLATGRLTERPSGSEKDNIDESATSGKAGVMKE